MSRKQRPQQATPTRIRQRKMPKEWQFVFAMCLAPWISWRQKKRERRESVKMLKSFSSSSFPSQSIKRVRISFSTKKKEKKRRKSMSSPFLWIRSGPAAIPIACYYFLPSSPYFPERFAMALDWISTYWKALALGGDWKRMYTCHFRRHSTQQTSP